MAFRLNSILNPKNNLVQV